MTEHQRHEPRVDLELIVDKMRDMSAPAGPDAAFQRRLVARLASFDGRPSAPSQDANTRRITMRTFFGVAASIVIVGTIGWVATLNRTSSGAAFAQMLQQMADVRTAVFTSLAQIGETTHSMKSKTMLLEPDWVREEIVEGDNNHLTIHVHNVRQRKSLMLQPGSKQARLRTMDGQSIAQPKNAIELIRSVRESSATFLGREQVDGTETLKYRCDHPTGHYLLWIAPATDLPVKVVITETADDAEPQVTITLTDFQWNVPLDTTLFTLEVPEGYEFEQERLAMSVLDPENLIVTLKAYVRLNNNEFPDEFNALSPGSMIQFLDDPKLPPAERMANYRQKLAHAMERPDLARLTAEQWQKEAPNIGRIFATGAAFLQAITQSHDWHYIGKGVKLGEADKIVAWWAPKEATDDLQAAERVKTATVLFGDLHIETKPADGLPTNARPESLNRQERQEEFR
jgi:outer membrane lipoprotein-sorting protein